MAGVISVNTTTSQQMNDPQPGERWGDFTFAGLVHEGMSSNLHLIWHHRYWSPMVIKMMRASDRDDQRWREMLKREADILQAVTHPNIVRVFDVKMDAALPYMLLGYLPGRTIKQVLRQDGAFNLEDAVRLTMYVGGTLNYIHRRGYIHRDIKPSNIMLNAGYVKLFDFGVAWQLSDQKPSDKSGTPMYLAPEQCRQDVLTPAVDIWALGIFLFELLTAKLPFPESDYDNYDAPIEIRYSQLTTRPLTLRAAGCDAPAGVQAIIDCCLAFDPAERYQNVTDLLLELDPYCRAKIWPAIPDAAGEVPDLAAFLNVPSAFAA